MQVVGRGPLRAGSLLWQPAPGAFSLTVVGKLTFALAPGESPLAKEQEDVYETDAYWDDDPARSLVQSTDLVPSKSRPEVLLIGSAYAPDQLPVGSVSVRLRVGDVDKSLRVWGERWFSPGGVLEGPTKVTRIPLSWERAAGGPDTANPVGVGMGKNARSDGRGRTLVPNMEPMGCALRERHETFAPAGFGPIAPMWRPRLARLQHHASSWDHARWSEAPLPSAFDFGFWNVAPPDQHLAELRGDETLFLENLDRRHPRLSTRLANVRPHAWIEWAGGDSRGVALAPDTLIIDTDRGLAILVYRGAVALDHPRSVRRVTVEASLEGAAEREPWLSPSMSSLRAQASFFAAPVHDTVALAPAHSGADPGMTLAASLLPSPDHSPLPFTESMTDGTLAPGFDSASSALPFVHHAQSAGPEWLETSPERSQASVQGDTAALPFRRGQMDAALPGDAPAPAQAYSFDVPALPLALMPSFEERSHFDAVPPPATPSYHHEASHIEGAPVFQTDADTVHPPPMVGPLATAQMVLAHEAREILSTVPASPAVAPTVVLETKPPPLPLEDISLARCAALDASIARSPGETAKILKTADLDDTLWNRLKAHYAAAIRAETRRGKSTSLRAYDAAYVAQLEKERGPITVEEVAKLAVATERGESKGTLESLQLPNAALIRIQRAWILKTAGDPGLGVSMRETLTRTRTASDQ